VQESDWSPHAWKRTLTRLPVINELLAGDLTVVARRPPVERRLIPAREVAVVPFVVGMALVVVAGLARS